MKEDWRTRLTGDQCFAYVMICILFGAFTTILGGIISWELAAFYLGNAGDMIHLQNTIGCGVAVLIASFWIGQLWQLLKANAGKTHW